MSPVSIGAVSGLVLGATTSFLITGRLFHSFQTRTPATWRPESWRQHFLALLIQLVAGAALGWLYALSGAPSISLSLLELAAAIWLVVACCLLIHALYVNWHPGFVVGMLIDWAVFAFAVLLACAEFGYRAR